MTKAIRNTTSVNDTDDGSIEVMPSSAVAAGDFDPPFVWVTIRMHDGREAFVHLHEAGVRKVIAALLKALNGL